MTREKAILVIVEDCNAVSLSLAGEAAKLALSFGGSLCVMVPNSENINRFFQAGAERVIAVDMPSVYCDDAAIALWLAGIIRLLSPEIVLFNATIRGRAIAPAVAAILHTGLTADCTALAIDARGRFIQTRPTFGNRLMAEIICEKTRPQMASVRPGIFPDVILDEKRHGNAEFVSFEGAGRIVREKYRTLEGTSSLQQAEIIFAAGKGVGSREGFQRLSEMALEIGAGVAASRAAVDNGFAPYSCQVGQTGIVVRPRLYIAVGISGSTQHLAGMNGAEKVAAINTDPKAPIFHYADYGIIGDWQHTLEIFLSEYKTMYKEKIL
jgi:electron transfer flavoprotein alpha subunit